MSPGDLGEILEPIRTAAPPELLVGFETADDAGVYRLDADRAVVATADFITPVVDDPRDFGRVAAANSLSDVYAMGGVPLMALNLLGYPPAGLPNAVLGEILAGGAEICAEARCAVAGGHSVRDEEVKYGLAVTGVVHPRKILRNSTARPGDLLLLTKPLGTGALVAAAKAGKLSAADQRLLVDTMSALNRAGPFLADRGATACTDVTGFGLSGHALEMALGADVAFHIATTDLPLLPGAVDLCTAGFTCGGTRANAAHAVGRIALTGSISDGMVGLLNDPQTSGGLLISVPPARRAEIEQTVLAAGSPCAAVIGDVHLRAAGEPYLVFA